MNKPVDIDEEILNLLFTSSKYGYEIKIINIAIAIDQTSAIVNFEKPEGISVKCIYFKLCDKLFFINSCTQCDENRQI